MTATPFDSAVLNAHLSDPDAARLFTDAAEIRAMMLVEGALARAQGETGDIPKEAAEAIYRAAREAVVDPAGLAAGTAAAGVSVPAFVEAFRKAMEAPEPAAWVHHGATSQDILDTALILRLRRLLDLLDDRLAQTLVTLAEAARRWRDLPMAARTRGQVATPTTFGARVAVWGAPLLRSRERLAQLRPRLLTLSLAGASGTSAALGPKARDVARLMGEELDLAVPDVPWHAARDGLAELAAALAILAGVYGKMGLDLLLLAQTETAEVRAGEGGGSSTMPHKSNPVGAEAVVALARHAARLSGGMVEAMAAGHERDGTAWTLEWLTLPQLCLASAAASRHGLELARTLRPDAGRMAATLAATGGLSQAEAATFRLVEAMPRPEAQAAVKAACGEVAESGAPLAEVLARRLADEPRAAGVDWASVLAPEAWLGEAPAIADRFAEAVDRALA